MILWLDHKIFGNGHGLGAPFWDQRYYWLTRDDHKRGELYTYSHGFGAQLHSIQWTHPKAGERRRLNGHEFKVFSSSRRWLRVMVSWSLVHLPRDIDGAHEMMRKLDTELANNMRTE